ncbi:MULTISPECIES: hypothetical protein [unclassified Sphingomonas]|uniref:hypothetical protein n=1 Tax=unclassified Sphingomonas TaxID=196159 RepID=UPI00092B9B16|nr:MULTISPECIES: hypothetical protein [unclassified Sphingomonas]MBN8847369.1 hypothetical protein [Sphingomonas sp.]OJV28223.1 MAG: hypothetical protein BGO24_07785 [Sphingomonas sp. 67-36]
MRPIAPATSNDRVAVARACALLREARDLLRRTGAPRAHKAVIRGLKSAEGAERHVAHRLRRSTS